MICDHSPDYCNLPSMDQECKTEQKTVNICNSKIRKYDAEHPKGWIERVVWGFFNLASSLHTTSDLFPGAAHNIKGLHKKTFTMVSSSLFHTQQS